LHLSYNARVTFTFCLSLTNFVYTYNNIMHGDVLVKDSHRNVDEYLTIR